MCSSATGSWACLDSGDAAGGGLGDGAAGRLHAPRRHSRHGGNRRSFHRAVGSHGRTAHHQGLWPGRPQHRAGGCTSEAALAHPAEGGAAARGRRADRPIYFRAPWSLWCCSLLAGRTCMAQITLNTFAAFTVALLLALQPVRNLSQLWPTASAGIAAANRIFDAIDARPGIVDRPGAQPLVPAGRRRQFPQCELRLSWHWRGHAFDT